MKSVKTALSTILVLFTVSTLCVGWWLNSTRLANDNTIAIELISFDKLRSVAAKKSIIPKPNITTNAAVNDMLYLKGETIAVTEAGLLALIKQMAVLEGIEVARASSIPARTEGPLTVISGSLEMIGNISAVYRFIAQIETAKPLLQIDRLVIRSNASAQNTPEIETLLNAEISISGFSSNTKTLVSGDAQP